MKDLKAVALAALLMLIAAFTGAGNEVRGSEEESATPPASPAPKFKGVADLADVVQIASGFSEDKQAVTVIFRNLQVGVGGQRGPLVGTRSVTMALPVENKDRGVRVTQDVRGFVEVHGKARAVLVVQAAGRTTVVDL